MKMQIELDTETITLPELDTLIMTLTRLRAAKATTPEVVYDIEAIVAELYRHALDLGDFDRATNLYTVEDIYNLRDLRELDIIEWNKLPSSVRKRIGMRMSSYVEERCQQAQTRALVLASAGRTAQHKNLYSLKYKQEN